MRWHRTTRFDPRAAAIADRHYSRVRPGTGQFMPHGRALVLLTADGDAVWGSSWQRSHDTAYAYHDYPQHYVCCIFRNESPHLSSELVREAVAATRHAWGDDGDGFVTFVKADAVRRKRDPGRCFIRAGWHANGRTKGGLVILTLPRAEFPDPEPAVGDGPRLLHVPLAPLTRQRRYPGGPIDEFGA